jgi:ribosomal protein L24
MGYNELPGGKKEAMVTYNDDLVVVHEGDLIGTKFKVVKIDPAKVVVEDGDTHQTLELAFPQ